MIGGPPRAVWHSTENDPNKTTAYTIANYLNRVGYAVHIVWNPVTGETIQMIPANRAGRGLKNLTGGVQTNRQGSVCIQIEVVAHAAEPFTKYPMKGREALIGWLRSFDIPDVWPGGPPPPSPQTAHVSSAVWTSKGGHYGHSQIPENDHNDPGAIDIKKLLSDDMPTADEIATAVVRKGYNSHGDKVGQALQELFFAGSGTVNSRLAEIESKIDQILAKLAA